LFSWQRAERCPAGKLPYFGSSMHGGGLQKLLALRCQQLHFRDAQPHRLGNLFKASQVHRKHIARSFAGSFRSTFRSTDSNSFRPAALFADGDALVPAFYAGYLACIVVAQAPGQVGLFHSFYLLLCFYHFVQPAFLSGSKLIFVVLALYLVEKVLFSQFFGKKVNFFVAVTVREFL
jgi:hypothetical protein